MIEDPGRQASAPAEGVTHPDPNPCTRNAVPETLRLLAGKGCLLAGKVRIRTVQLTIRERMLRSNEKQFQGGLVFKARRLLYHSTLGRE